MMQTLAMVATAALLALLTTVPAHAQSRTIDDQRDSDLAAKYDIRRVVLNNTDRRLVVTVKVRNMRSRNVMLNVKFHDGRGAPHYARIYRNSTHGEGHEVLVQINAGDPWTTYSCPGLRQEWQGEKDRIILSLPHRCGGAALDRFKVYTGPWGAGVVRDKVTHRRQVLPDL